MSDDPNSASRSLQDKATTLLNQTIGSISTESNSSIPEGVQPAEDETPQVGHSKVAVVLRCPEAQRLGEVILPKTGCTSATSSAGEQTLEYRVESKLSSWTFEDTDGTPLLARHGTDKPQPAALCSNSETEQPGANTEPSLVNSEALKGAVTDLPLATLLTRHLRDPTRLREMAESAATILLARRSRPEDVERFVRAIISSASNDNTAPEVERIINTAASQAKVHPIAGLHRLSRLVGRSPVDRFLHCMSITPLALAPNRDGPLRLISIDDLKDLPPPNWLVESIIPNGAFALLYGPPGCGKTFVGLDLALHVSAGRSWQGFPVESGPVVYVAAESPAALQARVTAFEMNNDTTAAEIHFLPGAVQLRDENGRKRFLAAIDQLPEYPVLIVIDTLARCFVGGDENSAKDMGELIAAVDEIRTLTGAAVLLVHHTGKEGLSERGSSALRGAADTMLLLKGSNRTLTLKCDKQKDAEHFKDMHLALRPISIGSDRRDTSCVVVSSDAKGDGKALNDSEQRLLKIIQSDFPSGAKRKDLLEKYLEGPEPHSVSTFDRCLRSLDQCGWITKLDDNRWVLGDRQPEGIDPAKLLHSTVNLPS